jgi:hypothetical protein
MQVVGDHIIGWVAGTTRADVAWWVEGHDRASRICGIETEQEALALWRRIVTDPTLRPCWDRLRTRELTPAELDATADGATLHWTNFPGRPSQPVTRVHHEHGNVQFGDGTYLTAMADELTLVPRTGLDA